jgi:DNA-binding IclR family transcriptional regulator
VLTLSGGHDSRDQFVKSGRPILDRYCAQLRWPLALSTPHGLSLRVRYTTDVKTPYKIFTSPAGIDVPLTQSATGLTYLAWLDRSDREFLLNSMAEQDSAAPKLTQLTERLESIRRAGYCYVDQSFVRAKQFKGYEMREGIIGVPVIQSGKPIAVIALRFVKRGRTAASVARIAVGPMQECARELVAAVSSLPKAT